jgi:3-hydroxyisobutyrate dehydrogenase-like beta-hydroxyacid dehydrogenase
VTAIGFVGFGEVASRFAPALQANGAKISAYDVLLERPGGGEGLRRRADGCTPEFRPLADVIAQSDIVLSTVTTEVAVEVAKSCACHLHSGQVFVDLNATSPAVKRVIGDIVTGAKAEFIEGAILGAVGVTGARTHILVSGEKAASVAKRLAALGLNAAPYGREIGRASTFKLLRSIVSKGLEALLLEARLAARRAGMEEDIWREIVETLDARSFDEVGSNWMRTHATAHVRRHHEMVQVAQLLHDLHIQPLVTQGVTAFFERSARLGLAKKFESAAKAPSEVVGALDELLESEGSLSMSRRRHDAP